MYISKNGYKKYKSELEELQLKLPYLIKETGEMAALGDRSENAGYINAKQNMRKAQGRIRYLEDLLKHSKIIENNDKKTINIGSKVTILNIKDNVKSTYTIVDSLEADPLNSLISFHSPLGSALLNKTSGQNVVITTPTHTTEYKIILIT